MTAQLPSSGPPRRRRIWLATGFFALAIAAGFGWSLVHFRGPSMQARAAAPAPAPVHVATVERSDFPVYLTGLGTVQPLNTVTVRSRVDGEIVKVGFEEGQMLKAGDLLVQLDPAPFQAALDQATAKLTQDQASLGSAKQDLQRTTALVRQGDATKQLFDQQTANVANLTALVQADRAAIEGAKVQLAYTTIRSPLTGRAGFRLVDPGNIVHANDPNGILTITQLRPIAVVFTAPEQQLPEISAALKGGPLPTEAYSSTGDRLLASGSLDLIDNQVDQASGTIRLKAKFDNKDDALWPGLSVTTRLLVKTHQNAIVVPDAAVQRGPNGLYAYVVNSDDKAEMRPLKVGPIAGGRALVEEGLNPGERVVTAGHYRVVPGGAVQLLPDGNAQAALNTAAARAVRP